MIRNRLSSDVRKRDQTKGVVLAFLAAVAVISAKVIPEAEGKKLGAPVPAASTTAELLNPKPGSAISDKVVLMEGTAPPNSNVELLRNGDYVVSTTTQNDGKWSMTAEVADPKSSKYSLQFTSDNGTRLSTIEDLKYKPAGPKAAAPKGKAQLPLGGKANPPSKKPVAKVETKLPDREAVPAPVKEAPKPKPVAKAAPKPVAKPKPIAKKAPAAHAPKFTVSSPFDHEQRKVGTWHIKGWGRPGATVILKLDNVTLGTTKVPESGRWVFTRKVHIRGRRVLTGIQCVNKTPVAKSKHLIRVH